MTQHEQYSSLQLNKGPSFSLFRVYLYYFLLILFFILMLTFLPLRSSFSYIGFLFFAALQFFFVLLFIMRLKDKNAFFLFPIMAVVAIFAAFYLFIMLDLSSQGRWVREEDNLTFRQNLSPSQQHFHSSRYWRAQRALQKSFRVSTSRPLDSQQRKAPSSLPIKNFNFPPQFAHPTREILTLGKETYDFSCASCHGKNGDGHGPAAYTLTLKPTDFSKGEFRYGRRPLDLFRIISNGSPRTPQMMPWKKILLPKERWALVHYIYSLDKSKKKR